MPKRKSKKPPSKVTIETSDSSLQIELICDEISNNPVFKNIFKIGEELLTTLINYERNILSLKKEDVDLLKINLEQVIPHLQKIQNCINFMDIKENIGELPFSLLWSTSLVAVHICDVNKPFHLFLKKEYNEFVKLRLYPAHILDVVHGIEGYNTFSVRLREDNIIECMVCNYFVSQTKVGALFDHICSLFHMEQLQLHCDNLSKYHDFWIQQHSSKQDIQLLFSYINEKNMKCKQCEKCIKYDDVLLHPNPCNQPKVKRSQNIAKPINEVGYAHRVKTSIFFDVPYLNIDGINYPVMQRIQSDKNKCVCMICSSMVSEDFWGHCESDMHLFYQSSYILTETIKKYHQIFSSFEVSKQVQVVYYHFRENSILCLLCKHLVNLDPAEIITHMKNIDHCNNLKSVKPNDLIDLIGKSLEYCEDNSSNVNIPSVIVEETNYPIIQVCHDSTLYCLTCHVTLRRTIMEHLIQPEHFKSATNKFNISTLALYHDIFKTLPDRFQNDKIFFRKRATDIRCVLCSGCVTFDGPALLHHIKTRHLKGDKFQHVRVPPTTLKVDDISGGDMMNIKKHEGCSSKSSTPTPQFVPPEGMVNLKGSRNKGYDPNTIKELFEDVPHTYINGAFYPVFQKIARTVHCLFCVETLQHSLDNHLNLIEHKNKLSSSQDALCVQNYHEIFCSLPYELQTQQIHFKRCGKFLECRLCQHASPYCVQAVYQHISTKRHKKMCDETTKMLKVIYIWKFVRNYVYKDSNLDTLIFLMDKKIKGNVHNILEIIFQADRINLPCAYINQKFYPVFQIINGNLHCLICNEDLLENPFEHVTNDITHLGRESMYLKRIIKYYNIWNSLPENVQIQQSLFRMKKKHFKCLLCTLSLPYEVVLIWEHFNSEEHEQNIYQFVLDQINNQSELIVANNLGYYIDTNLNLDSMLYLADIEINKTKEHDLVSKQLNENDSKRNESVVKDTAADHFPLQSVVFGENIYGTWKTAQYNKLKELDNLKRIECLAKNIAADHFPLQSTGNYENIYGTYKTAQYKAIKDIEDLKKRKLLVKNIAADYFPLQSIDPYENIYGTYKTAQYKAIKDIEDLKKRKLLVKNIAADHFPHQLIDPYENIYGIYKTTEYKAIKDIEDLKKRKLLVKNIAADNIPTQSFNHWENLYGIYTTNRSPKRFEINRIIKSLSLLKNSKSDVAVNVNTTMDQNQTHNSKNSKQHEVYQKASIEFPPYDVSILNSIYKNGLIHYNIKIDNIKYPVIQNLGLYKHCIICEKSITSEIFHCNSDEHIKNSTIQVKKLLLKDFHQVFALLPKHYQEQQKYFRKEEQLKCILCNVGIKYDFGLILSHIQEKDHIMKQEKFERSPNTSRGNSPFVNESLPDDTKSPNKENKQIIESIAKSNLTSNSNINKPTINGTSKETLKYSLPAMIKLFQNLEEYTIKINNNEFFLLRNSTFGIRCLLCIDGPAFNPADHVKTSNHIKHTTNQVALKNFEKLHHLWMTSKDNQQEQLFYIVQRHCHLCQVTLKHDYILKHIETKGHLDKVDQDKRLTASTQLLKMETKTEDEKNGIIENQKIVDKNFAITEIMSNYTENISSTQESQDVIQNGIEHDEDTKSEDIASTDNLQVNYASWVKATIYYGLAKYTVSVNGNLFPYLRRTFQGLRCILCQDEEVISISDHLKTSHHTQQLDNPKAWLCVQDFHDYWSRKTDPISQNQQIYVINGKCVLCRHYNHTTNINEHLPSKEHRITEDGVDCDELIDVMGLRDKFRYCDQVEKTLYKDLDQYFTYHGLIKLPLLRLTKEGVRCILCDDTGVTSPAQHVKTPAHQQALYNYDKREKLWNFHKMWQKMEPAAQAHQQHVILMMCLACDRKISLETGEAHVLSKAHQGNIKMKEKNQAKPKRVVTHDIKPSIPSPDPHNLMSQIPWYFTPHFKFLKPQPNNKNEITCTACKKLFTNAMQIRTHLDTKDHCIASKLDQIKNQFLCEICMRKAKNEKEWLEHLQSGNHTTCVQGLGTNRKSTMKENTCVTCNMVIFGDTVSVMRHNKSKNNKGGVETTLTKGMKRLLSSKKAILSEAMNLVKIVDHDIDKSKADVNECCKALEKTLSAYYSMCRVYPFGSRVTGLGNRESDLDVFIDIGGIYDGSRFQSADEQANIVLKVGDLLKKNKKQFTNIVTVPGARTPIVRVFHIQTGIDCDISFRHGLSVENTEFIRFCIELQPILRPTLLFLKLWLSNTDLPYGTPTSYAFTMLVIFFMQQQNYLLSVDELRFRNRKGKVKIDGWEVVEYTTSIAEMKKYVRECTVPLPELLKQFFGYYENFNFGSLVVCPLLGHMIDKSHFVPQQPDLPPQMNTYVRKLNEPNGEVLKHHTPMCVQDPFDLSHNVTKGCSGIAAKMFQKYCKLSKSHISALQ
ncbi:uncharacterized protein [Onthophagus taurus]|uniref:uncharacterized protein isoform X2 n=1 Tax=Onthophagus taurus TaxID=166361 RepID=UPI0039BEBF95